MDVLSKVASWAGAPRWLAGPARVPASAVTFEFGRGEASILVSVLGEGRAHLRLGSGEEFLGPCDEMPLAVVKGARRLLAAAGPVATRRAFRAAAPADGSPVRVAVESGGELHETRLTLATLRDPDSPLAPLWDALTAWLGPFLVVLFGDAPNSMTAESTALTRARALCRPPARSRRDG